MKTKDLAGGGPEVRAGSWNHRSSDFPLGNGPLGEIPPLLKGRLLKTKGLRQIYPIYDKYLWNQQLPRTFNEVTVSCQYLVASKVKTIFHADDTDLTDSDGSPFLDFELGTLVVNKGQIKIQTQVKSCGRGVRTTKIGATNGHSSCQRALEKSFRLLFQG